jgi:GTP-binding protein Era
MPQRCGYVALVGRPNAGKSTLLNALVGDKLAVVSRRPQTTRNKILGVVTDESTKTQICFLDTPGIHKAKRSHLLNKAMNRAAIAAAGEADIVLFLVDPFHGWREQDDAILKEVLASSKAPIAIVGSKTDALKRDAAERAIDKIADGLKDFLARLPDDEARAAAAERFLVDEILPVSAKRPEDVSELRAWLGRQMPEGPWMFEADDLTDRPRQFLCGELIREQIFRQLGDEIPYGCAVRIDGIEFKGALVVVRATIVVTRKQHKAIVVGKGGSRIKELGTEARAALEKHFGQKVFLELNVQISEGWIDDRRLLSDLAQLDESGDLHA